MEDLKIQDDLDSTNTSLKTNQEHKLTKQKSQLTMFNLVLVLDHASPAEIDSAYKIIEILTNAIKHEQEVCGYLDKEVDLILSLRDQFHTQIGMPLLTKAHFQRSQPTLKESLRLLGLFYLTLVNNVHQETIPNELSRKILTHSPLAQSLVKVFENLVDGKISPVKINETPCFSSKPFDNHCRESLRPAESLESVASLDHLVLNIDHGSKNGLKSNKSHFQKDVSNSKMRPYQSLLLLYPISQILEFIPSNGPQGLIDFINVVVPTIRFI